MALSLAGIGADGLFLLAPFAVYGTLPNYVKAHGAWAGIVESVRLRPPVHELWHLVTDQPVFEVGVVDRFGFVPLQLVVTPHSLLTILALPALVAVSLLLVLQLRRTACRRTLRLAGVSASTVACLVGASTSAAACCGASSGPVLLMLLGIGFGTASLIVDYAALLEAAGYTLLIASILALARWLAVHAPGREERGLAS